MVYMYTITQILCITSKKHTTSFKVCSVQIRIQIEQVKQQVNASSQQNGHGEIRWGSCHSMAPLHLAMCGTWWIRWIQLLEQDSPDHDLMDLDLDPTNRMAPTRSCCRSSENELLKDPDREQLNPTNQMRLVAILSGY